MRYSPLLTDLYELTMLAGYLEQGMHERPAVFDLFFRHNPFNGSYAVFAGLETALSSPISKPSASRGASRPPPRGASSSHASRC